MSGDIIAPVPAEGDPWDVAIVGSGPAGFTSAIYTTRGAISTVMFAGYEWGGQLMLTTMVDNFPGFPEGIEGPQLMQNMRAQAERFGAQIIGANVDNVNLGKQPLEIVSDGKTYKTKTIIIATGAKTMWLNVPGEDRLRGRGVSSCAPCDAPFFVDKKVFVVGGGDSAMEEALVLTKYSPKVTVIHRRDELKASAIMQQRAIDNEKIDFIWDTQVIEMHGEQMLTGVTLKTNLTGSKGKNIKEQIARHEGEVIEEKDGFLTWKAPAEGLFVAIGHKPATDIFQGTLNTNDKGYLVRNPQEGLYTATNVPGVFVAGDVHDTHYQQAVTAAAYGCMAAMDVLRYLDKPTPNW